MQIIPQASAPIGCNMLICRPNFEDKLSPKGIMHVETVAMVNRIDMVYFDFFSPSHKEVSMSLG